MVIDATQDTTQKFEQIKNLATTEYRKHFDPDFVSLPPLPKKRLKEDLAVALNNRASIMPIQVIRQTFQKNNTSSLNKQVQEQRTNLLCQAYNLDKLNDTIAINWLWD